MDCGTDQFVTIVESEIHNPTLMGKAYMGENRPSSDEDCDEDNENGEKKEKKIYLELVLSLK